MRDRPRSVQIAGVDLVVLPTSGWRDVLADGRLDGVPVVAPSVAARWLERHGDVLDTALGAWQGAAGWRVVPLLHLGERWLPVHLEDVICDACRQRCGLSASPETGALPGVDADAVWALFDGLPVQACPHCGATLRRRHTVWFAARGDTPASAAPTGQARR